MSISDIKRCGDVGALAPQTDPADLYIDQYEILIHLIIRPHWSASVAF
jgi:hypothetical protein